MRQKGCSCDRYRYVLDVIKLSKLVTKVSGIDNVLFEVRENEEWHCGLDMWRKLAANGPLQNASSKGGVPLVRLSGNDPIQAKAVLDAGAAGIMVPMVNSKAEAEKAVGAVKYPPEGTRGACGAQRGQGYGYGNYLNYVRSSNKNSFVMVQIEHIDAVNNIEEIVSVQGLDGTFIGPYDLSMSMGLPGQLNHPDVEKAKHHVQAVTRAHGLAAGIHIVHPDTAIGNLKASIKSGYQFIALGTDILLLGNACRILLEDARTTQKREENY